MAEGGKIQELKRSISSWSLSTFKKPKIRPGIFKKKGIFIGKRNRENIKTEISSPLEANAQIIHDPNGKKGGSQPKIVLTQFENDESADKNTENSLSDLKKTQNSDFDHCDQPSPKPDIVQQENVASQDGQNTLVNNGSVNNCLDNNDIAFIDDVKEDDREDIKISNDSYNPQTVPDTVYQWYDASSSTYAPQDASIYYESRFYDASEFNEIKTQLSGNVYEDLQAEQNESPELECDQSSKLEKSPTPPSITKSDSKLLRSVSELEIDSEWKKRAKKYEIRLNTKSGTKALSKLFKKTQKDGNSVAKESKPNNLPVTKEVSAVRKESLKKLFEIRRKLSVKNIKDSNEKRYKEADIYIASTPYALAKSSACETDNGVDSIESTENYEEGIPPESFNFEIDKKEICATTNGNEIPVTDFVRKDFTPGNDNISEELEKQTNVNSEDTLDKKFILEEFTKETKGNQEKIIINTYGTENVVGLHNNAKIEESLKPKENLVDNSLDNESVINKMNEECKNTANIDASNAENINLEEEFPHYQSDDHLNDKVSSNSKDINLNTEKVGEIVPQPKSKYKEKEERLHNTADRQELENFKAEINKHASSSSYISRTFKSIKENIFPSEYYKEKVYRKKRLKLNPFNKKNHAKKDGPAEAESKGSKNESYFNIPIIPNENQEGNQSTVLETFKGESTLEDPTNLNQNQEENSFDSSEVGHNESISELNDNHEMLEVLNGKLLDNLPKGDSLVHSQEATDSLSNHSENIGNKLTGSCDELFNTEEGLIEEIKKLTGLDMKINASNDTASQNKNLVNSTSENVIVNKAENYRDIEESTKNNESVDTNQFLLANKESDSAINSSYDRIKVMPNPYANDLSERNKYFEEATSCDKNFAKGSSTNEHFEEATSGNKHFEEATSAKIHSEEVTSVNKHFEEDTSVKETNQINTDTIPISNEACQIVSDATTETRLEEENSLQQQPVDELISQNSVDSSQMVTQLPGKIKETYSEDNLRVSPISLPPDTKKAPAKPIRKCKKLSDDKKNFPDHWRNQSHPNIHLITPKIIEEENTRSAPNSPPVKDNCYSRDSGYGTCNNDSSSPPEPIYWEITERPKPSPRRKKEKSEQNLTTASRPTSIHFDRSFSINFANPIDVPEWIQQRPPIPSPRARKQKSTLSLNTDTTATSAPYDFGLNPPPWLGGEDFYSGKAASISYGVTTPSNELPPILPLRNKKPSLVSLPGFGFSEECEPKECHDLLLRRKRRRTAPAPPSPPPPRRNHRVFIQSEDHLKDVLYSVVSLMGDDMTNAWQLKTENEGRSVTFKEVTSYLKEVYQVSPQSLNEIIREVASMKAPDIFLHIRIEEAADLRPKTVKGGTNPFVIVQLSSSPHTQRTRSETETLTPKWRQDFKFKIANLRKDVLTLETMHDYGSLAPDQLKDVRDLSSVSRLISNAKALKHPTKLLGKTTIPVMSFLNNNLDEWFPLLKEDAKDDVKERGRIRIKAILGAVNNENKLMENRKKFEILLANVIHHSNTLKNDPNSEQSTTEIPYNGYLPLPATATIIQYAIVYNLRPSLQDLSWWVVGSQIPSADMGWLLGKLNKVLIGLTENFYSNVDLEVLADSFSSWTRMCLHKLKNLQTSFPATSGVLARHQLTGLLQIAMKLDDHQLARKLLAKRNISNIRGKMKDTILEHVEVWWKSLANFREVVDLQSQMKKMISFLFEVELFFKTVAAFYSPVFLKEAKIPFFREVFLLVTKNIHQCVLLLLQNIDGRSSSPRLPEEDIRHGKMDISVGPDLWQIYVNLRRLHSLGAALPPDVLEESGLNNYHKWFEKAVLRWIEYSRKRSLIMIHKAVEFDTLQPDDDFHNFSSSSTDTIGIFTEVQIWWKRLEWPDAVNSGVFLAKLLHDVCSNGTAYSELLKAKVDAAGNSSKEELIISEQTCVGLNNIEKVRHELTLLPDRFDVEKMAELIESSPSGGASAAETFEKNVQEVIRDSSLTMERKVVEFIDSVIEKRKDRLHNLVIISCEEGHEGPLLSEVLDPSLHLLQQKLDNRNFRRLVSRLWDEILDIFDWVVSRTSEDKRSSYFEVILNIIEATLKFFTPSNGVGLNRDEAKTQKYVELTDHLQLRKLPSDKLIEKYYQDRYSEHSQPFNEQKAELVMKVYFTKLGKLKTEIIMAKNMIITQSDATSMTSKHSTHSSTSGQYVDSFVKVQLVPAVWFKDATERKTKVTKRSDPAVYDEEFEFDLCQHDNGVANGFLLVTLKHHNLAKGNDFIGEAVIPLKDLQAVDSADVGSVNLSRLKMTSPGLEIGYKSLAILKLRTSDSIAKNFIKKVSKRIPDGRKKTFFNTTSSDEEKSKSKNPVKIIRRRKIS